MNRLNAKSAALLLLATQLPTHASAYGADKTCNAGSITPEDQTARAQLVRDKFKSMSNCSVAEVMALFEGDLPLTLPEATRQQELFVRCTVTADLLSDSISTCQAALDRINDATMKGNVSKIMLQRLTDPSFKGSPSHRFANALSPSGSSSSVDANTAAPAEGQTPNVSAESAIKANFFKRFIEAYTKDPANPPPSYTPRGYAPPENSPPFPSQDWPIGGTTVIGHDNRVYNTPLQQALGTESGLGKEFTKANIQVYGWVDVGGNISNSRPHDPNGPYGNAPSAYYAAPDTIQPDQFTFFVERTPNSVQTDHVDWGFRVTPFYGTNYRYTISEGIFSNQLIKDNKKAGWDVPMAYFDLYIPVVDGLNVRIGRFISVPDIEAQLATSNLNYSHSMLYSVDAYTQSGVIATQKIDKHWTLQAGVNAGNDVAIWSKYARLTFNACANFTWQEGKSNLYVCDNSINNGHYGYNNMNQYNATIYHQFSGKWGKWDLSKWNIQTEGYYMIERQVPNLNGSTIPLIPNANGAHCPTMEPSCVAAETGFVNYTNRQLDAHSFISFRNGYMNDPRGQRTGTPDTYMDNVVSYNRFFLKDQVTFRPEFGHYESFQNPAFDNGLHKGLWIFAADLIVRW